MIKGIVLGALGVLALMAGGFYLLATSGCFPVNADADPPRIEKWLARKALGAAIARRAPKTPNPVALTDENLIAGIRLYAADCAVCHGAADGKSSDIARGLYQKAPQFAKYGVEDDEEGETYWTARHGIRLTGMPSFGASLSEDELWKITLFLKNMDSLPPAPKKAWEAVPSAAQAIARARIKRGAS